ncbi:hypothetical protein LguiA_000465 [Lonicera macranthoides]
MDKVEQVLEKLKELMMLVTDKFWGDWVVGWMDKVLPPETRGKQINHWFQLSTPFLIAGLLLIIFVGCCRICCCRRGGGRPMKMMKAPGRGGYRMPRDSFENNPRSYFRSLRSD